MISDDQHCYDKSQRRQKLATRDLFLCIPPAPAFFFESTGLIGHSTCYLCTCFRSWRHRTDADTRYFGHFFDSWQAQAREQREKVGRRDGWVGTTIILSFIHSSSFSSTHHSTFTMFFKSIIAASIVVSGVVGECFFSGIGPDRRVGERVEGLAEGDVFATYQMQHPTPRQSISLTPPSGQRQPTPTLPQAHPRRPSI